MIILTAVTVVALFLTLFFLGRTTVNFRRRRLLRCGGAGASCLAVAAISVLGVVMIFTYWSYERLTHEQVVSTIEFRRLASHQYQARLMISGRADRFFNLNGDEWQIDARLLTWQPPVSILGLDPVYKLERLSGRFSEIGMEQTEVRTVHALMPQIPVDMWSLTRRLPFILPGVDAYYGAATYVPMADGARFDVNLSRDALIARPANEAAEAALAGWGS